MFFHMKRFPGLTSPLLSHIIVPNRFVQDVNALVVIRDNNSSETVYTILSLNDHPHAPRDMS